MKNNVICLRISYWAGAIGDFSISCVFVCLRGSIIFIGGNSYVQR